MQHQASTTTMRVQMVLGKRKCEEITKNDCSRCKSGCNRYTKNVHNFVHVNRYEQIDELIQVAFEHEPYLSPRNMSAVWHRLSRLMTVSNHNQHQEPKQSQLGHKLNALITCTLDGLNKYSPIELRKTALAMAKIIKAVRNSGNGRETNYHQMFRDLLIGRDYYYYQMFRDILIGRDMEKKDTIFQAIASAAVPLLPQFDPQGYSNLAYACAIANAVPRFGRSTLLEHISCTIAALKDLRMFDPQALSNIVWAYATSKVSSHQRLFDKVAVEVVAYRDLRSFKPQELSNMIWAFATAEVSHPYLFETVADEVIAHRDLRSFKPQHLSNIVWAFATAQIYDHRLFEKVAEEVTYRHLGSFNPQNLSNIVWAFATARISQPTLFHKIAEEVIAYRRLGSLNPQALSNIVWAYATSKVSHPLLFYRMADIITVRKSSLTCQDVANILWSYSTSGIVDSSLFAALAPRVVILLDQFSSQELANIAWAYTVVNLDAPGLFNSAFANSLLEKMDSFNIAHLNQLYQWHIWQTKENSNAGLPPVLERQCYEAFTSTEPRISFFQRDVVSVLRSIGLNPTEEVLTQRGYSLDALIEVNGKKVGVEVDGPSHFIGRKPTGSTRLKQRQVANVEGLALVSVPYWEWDVLWESRYKKGDYLRCLLGMK